MDSVAVVSGGLDSVTMLHYLVKERRREPLVLLFDYLQRPAKELQAAKYQANVLGLQHMTVELPIREQPVGDINNYVPSRNSVFLTVAASLAESRSLDTVYIGIQADDRVWDCVPSFLDRMNAVFALSDRFKVRFEAPLYLYGKGDIVELGKRLEVDYSHTWSCFEGGDKPCGECKTCLDRAKAFEQADYADPLLLQA